jgi:glycosyltransferase involved in cell wall biosynthesis
MKENPTASIIINNFNYSCFLAESIDSALNQTYSFIEVIVVDDGSTDRSREIISSYGNRVIPVLKQNAGQASALNTGVEISKGEYIFFLDADDVFLPIKVEEMVKILNQIVQENPDAIISNYIETIDEKGVVIDIDILDTLHTACSWNHLAEIRGRKNKLIDGTITRLSTPEQVHQFVDKYRFIPYLGMPTSGFAMTRSLVKKVFPIPNESIRISADDFIVKGASIIGAVYLTTMVLTKYRIHGKNNWYGSQKKIQEDFFKILDDFLNSKLELVGKKPAFLYFDSIHAKGYYRTHYGRNCDRQLFNLAIKVITWHLNLKTINFFIKTMLLSFLLKFNRLNASLNTIN